MRWAALCAAIAILEATAQPAFKSSVQLVTVPFSVTNDKRDQLITSGLTASDFRVFEDGVPQSIALFSQDRRPTSICFVVDASGSMAAAHRVDRGVEVLRRTVLGLSKDDEISILQFSSGVIPLLPWTRNPDPKRLSWRLDPGAGTVANSSIADAVRVALEAIDNASNPRRVIVVISDGYENTSVTSLSGVATTRAQSEALVYAFGVAGPVERSPSGGSTLRNILPAIVGDSGGMYLNIASLPDVDAAAATLLADLQHQYTLAYAPSRPMDGKYRRIKVEITLPGYLVRHRGGYLALLSPSQQ